MTACEAGNTEVTLLPLDAGANVTLTDSNNHTALFYAIRPGSELDILGCMETAEAFTDAGDVFLLAAELGLYRVVSSCVGFRAPVDGMPLLVDYEDSKDRSTALHKSCENGHRQTAELLLKSRAIVDARNEDEETALALAAEAGKSEIINSLLAYGVDPRLLIGGQTIVIKMACSSGEDSLKHVEVVTMLLGVGVDVNAVDGSRHPALIWAVIKGKLEITRALMREPNADSNITSSFR